MATTSLLARNGRYLMPLAAVFVLLLTRWAIAGRLWGVRTDLIYWGEAGNGFVPLSFAVLNALAVVLILSGLLSAACNTWGQGWRWLAVCPLALLPLLGIWVSPCPADLQPAVRAGAVLVAEIEHYRERHNHYPHSLRELEYTGAVISSPGLASGRHWRYRPSSGSDAQRPGARASYLISLPLAPMGTLLYRPDAQYGRQHGTLLPGGWFHAVSD